MKRLEEKKEKKKLDVKSICNKLMGYMMMFSAVFYGGANYVYADKIADAAEGAATGIQASAQGAVKYVVIIVLVVAGFAFLGLGGQRAKEAQKESAWEKILGIALIVCAVPIAGLIFGWFN